MTRERYIWTEDALGATRALQKARTMTSSCTTSRRSIVDRVLWFAVSGLGLLLLCVALAEPPTTWSGMIAGLVLVSLSVIAALQHWGPIIPCMFFGMIAFSLLTSPILSSHEEAAFKAFGVR